MFITSALLKKLRVCSDAREWLESAFQGKVELTQANLSKCDRDDWICWLTCKVSEPYRFWCAGVAFREVAKINPSLAKYSMNVTKGNWKEARDAADAADADAADAAADAAAAAAAAAAADARSKTLKEMRIEAERVLLSLGEFNA